MPETPPLEIPIRFKSGGAPPDWSGPEKARIRDVNTASKQAAKEQAEAWKAAKKEEAEAAKTYAKMYLDEAKRTGKELTEAEKKEVKERGEARRIEDRFILAGYKDRVRQQIAEAKRLAADELRANKESADAAEKAAKANAAATIAANAKKRDAMQNLHVDVMRQMERQAEASDKFGGSLAGVVRQAIAMSGAMLAVQSAEAVFQILVEHAEKFRKYLFDSAEKLADLRAAIRELAALRGDLGVTGPTAAAVLAVGAKTLQTPEDVKKTEETFRGVAEVAIGKSIRKEDIPRMIEGIGKFATLEGGDAGAHGTLAAQIALQSGHMLSAEEMQARSKRMFAIQQPGAFVNLTQAVGQSKQLNPDVMSGVLSGEEAMGLASAFSLNNPESAAIQSQALIRGLLVGRVKARGMKIAEGIAFETTDKYIKSLTDEKGVPLREDATVIDLGKAVARDFARQTNADAGRGLKFDPNRYLVEHGFGDQDTRKAIQSYAALQNSGNMIAIEAAQNAALDMGTPGLGVIDALARKRFAADPLFQRKQMERFAELSAAKVGMEQEPIELWQRSAFQQLVAEGKQAGTFEQWKSKSGSFGRYGADAALLASGHDARETIGGVDTPGAGEYAAGR